jgi:Protein of unknown function (DUF4230)
VPVPSEFWKTIRWITISVLILAVVFFLGSRLIQAVEKGTSRFGSNLDSLKNALSRVTHSNTRIVEGRAELTEQKQVQELTLLALKMKATRSFESESFVLQYLPAGTKRLIVRGSFRVTVGYKLQPGVSLKLVQGKPVAQFPKPEILGVELLDYETLSEESGWANQITPTDRDQMIRELRLQMRSEALQSGVLEAVDQTLKNRLSDLLGTQNLTLEHR